MGRTVDEPTDSGLRSVLCAWRSEAGAQPDAVLGIIIVFPHMVKPILEACACGLSPVRKLGEK